MECIASEQKKQVSERVDLIYSEAWGQVPW
jgi:hypothetical protein